MTRAMERLVMTHAMARSLWGRREYNVGSRFLDELPAAVERERLRPSSWSGYGWPRQTGGGEGSGHGGGGAGARRRQPAGAVGDFRTGDAVRHATHGDGVVTRVEPGGLVTVRFADDGSERKLMLEYARLEKR
jgi:DNA helicase-2/ATP-dependent DNA helicase PcrA